jgi:hypothetical protein
MVAPVMMRPEIEIAGVGPLDQRPAEKILDVRGRRGDGRGQIIVEISAVDPRPRLDLVKGNGRGRVGRGSTTILNPGSMGQEPAQIQPTVSVPVEATRVGLAFEVTFQP